MDSSTQTAVAPVAILTPEERLDLRKRVLSGQALTLDEARAVIDSFRAAQGTAMLEAKAARKKSSKRPALSDEELDKDLEGLEL